MKKPIHLLSLIAALSVSSVSLVSAQENSSLTFASIQADSKEYGSKNRYPIGTEENPVTAQEYCDFLNASDKATQAKFFTFNSSPYYDGSFMDGESWLASNVNCIQRLGYLAYSYHLKAGHEHDSIVAVKSEEIQKEFTDWRNENNPAVEIPNTEETEPTEEIIPADSESAPIVDETVVEEVPVVEIPTEETPSNPETVTEVTPETPSDVVDVAPEVPADTVVEVAPEVVADEVIAEVSTEEISA